jgi:hypothetical protein
MPVPVIAAGLSTAGSLVQSNAQKNAAKANTAAESSIDNQLMSIFNSLMTNYNQVNNAVNPAQTLGSAKNFYQSEENTGLDPAVTRAANANFSLNNQRSLSSLVNQLGPALPNLAGTVRDFGENELINNANLNIGLAGQNQAARQQGAAGLAGIGEDVLGQGTEIAGLVSGGLRGLGDQFNNANIANANAPNPFSSLGGLFSNPAVGAWLGKIFGGGGGTPGASPIPPMSPTSFNNLTPAGLGVSPGQGGLGVTGGLGGGNPNYGSFGPTPTMAP